MATRGSPARRIPGNPLGSLLRVAAQQARSTTRRSVAVPGPPGAEGVAGPEGQQGVGAAVFTTLVTDAGGSVTWTFSTPLAATPVIAAVAAATAGVVVTVAAVSPTAVTLATWTVTAGALVASPSQEVHVTAFV